MALEIAESIQVATPPEAVWKLLADPYTWPTWWPGCRDAAAQDRKTLRDGSQLKLALRLGWITLPLVARVELATPGRALIWVGRGAGVTGRHAFYLDAKPNGTLVRQHEAFSGPGVLVFRLLRLDAATRRMFRANLKGLKRAAERAL